MVIGVKAVGAEEGLALAAGPPERLQLPVPAHHPQPRPAPRRLPRLPPRHRGPGAPPIGEGSGSLCPQLNSLCMRPSPFRWTGRPINEHKPTTSPSPALCHPGTAHLSPGRSKADGYALLCTRGIPLKGLPIIAVFKSPKWRRERGRQEEEMSPLLTLIEKGH